MLSRRTAATLFVWRRTGCEICLRRLAALRAPCLTSPGAARISLNRKGSRHLLSPLLPRFSVSHATTRRGEASRSRGGAEPAIHAASARTRPHGRSSTRVPLSLTSWAGSRVQASYSLHENMTPKNAHRRLRRRGSRRGYSQIHQRSCDPRRSGQPTLWRRASRRLRACRHSQLRPFRLRQNCV